MKRFMIILSMVIFAFGCSMNNSNVKSSLENNRVYKSDNSLVKVSKPAQRFMYVIGKGAPPDDENLSEVQRYLLAERAAIIDAYRQLAEKLQGFIVTTLTKSGNYIINMDYVKVQTESMIRGADIVEIHHNENGVCTAKIKIQIPDEKKIISCYQEY